MNIDWNIVIVVAMVTIVVTAPIFAALRAKRVRYGPPIPNPDPAPAMPPVKPPRGYQPIGDKPTNPPRGENHYGTVVSSVWHHMQCRDCQRFFAVEDAPAARNHWYCPWCGDHQEMRKAA